MTEIRDHYAEVLDRAEQLGLDPPRLAKVRALSIALIERGIAADDPSLPHYFAPLLDVPERARNRSPEYLATTAETTAPADGTSDGGNAQSAEEKQGATDRGGEESFKQTLNFLKLSIALSVIAGFVALVWWLTGGGSADPVLPDNSTVASGAVEVPRPSDLKTVPAYLLNWRLAVSVVAAIFLTLVALGLIIDRLGSKRVLRVRRAKLRDPGTLTRASVRAAHNHFFDDPAFRANLVGLRRYRSVPSQRIDVRASIRATIAQRTGPVLIRGRRRLSPDFVFLSEREHAGDHLAELAVVWRDRLLNAQIPCDHFEFFGDPNLLRPAAVRQGRQSGIERRLRIEDVLAVHERAHVAVMSESFDVLPVRDRLPGWLERVPVEAPLHFMTPRAAQYWAEDERHLADAGFRLFPATSDGTALFARNVELANGGAGAPAVETPSQPDLAAYLSSHREMLLADEEPTRTQVDILLDTLERWLDAEAFDWLRALALFPHISTGYTLFCGSVLKDNSIVTHERYLSLARLPWFRVAFMPDWVRGALVSTLSSEDKRRASAVAATYLDPPEHDVETVDELIELRRGKDDAESLARTAHRLQSESHPLFGDSLLIEALASSNPDWSAPPDEDLSPTRAQLIGGLVGLAAIIGIPFLLYSIQPETWKTSGLIEVGNISLPPDLANDVAPTDTPTDDLNGSSGSSNATQNSVENAVVPETVQVPVPKQTAAPIASPSREIGKKPDSVATTRLPDLVGLPEQDAKNIAEKLGLRLRTVGPDIQGKGDASRYDMPSAVVVISQSPSAGARIKKGDTVTVRLGNIAATQLSGNRVEQTDLNVAQSKAPLANQAPTRAYSLPSTGNANAPSKSVGDYQQTGDAKAPAASEGGTFTVYFEYDSTSLTPEAASILDNVSSTYDRSGPFEVRIAGYTDREGTAEYNVAKAERMAASVRDYLGSKGIPSSRMTVISYGESRPAVETADGVREPRNRRVEITLVADRPAAKR